MKNEMFMYFKDITLHLFVRIMIIFLEKRQLLNHFWPISHFIPPEKTRKLKGFLVFSGGIKWEYWSEMG